MVTGSLPVEKSVGDAVIGSYQQQWDHSKAEKVPVVETLLSQIGLCQNGPIQSCSIQDLTDKISGIFVPVVTILAIATFWVGLGASLQEAMLYAVSVSLLPVLVPWFWRHDCPDGRNRP